MSSLSPAYLAYPAFCAQHQHPSSRITTLTNPNITTAIKQQTSTRAVGHGRNRPPDPSKSHQRHPPTYNQNQQRHSKAPQRQLRPLESALSFATVRSSKTPWNQTYHPLQHLVTHLTYITP
jgi:hypothetical protein